MPNVRLPLSGDVLQNINPWNWFLRLTGSQVGLININLGRSADPELEEEILQDVGSYGRQLGRISDVLGILLRHVNLDGLDDAEKAKIAAFTTQLGEIDRLKARRAVALQRASAERVA
jgi:hypothetical protein